MKEIQSNKNETQITIHGTGREHQLRIKRYQCYKNKPCMQNVSSLLLGTLSRKKFNRKKKTILSSTVRCSPETVRCSSKDDNLDKPFGMKWYIVKNVRTLGKNWRTRAEMVLEV